MEGVKLIGKRKKKIEKCPNPLFESWLLEWKTDAAGKGLKSQHTYSRALQTLRKYPVVLTSGKECKILQNFGDKICQMLDEKLANHIAMYGTTLPVDNNNEEINYAGFHVPSPPKRKRTSAATATSGVNNAIGSPGNESGATRRRTASGPRAYVPQHRSGPYAIILTLFKKHQECGAGSFMTKKELMREAQPLADKSFTIPDPGSRYTAWSSMGTLINKGFITKHSSPAKYKITESGCELAERMLLADQQMPQAGGVKDDDGGRPGFMIGAGNRLVPPQLPNLSLPEATIGARMGNIAKSQTQTKVNIRLNSIEISDDSSDEEIPGVGNTGLLERIRNAQSTSTTTSLPLNSRRGVDSSSLSSTSAGFSNGFSTNQSQTRKPAAFAFSDSSDDDLERITKSNDISPGLKKRLSVLQASPPKESRNDKWPKFHEQELKFWYIDDNEREVMNKDRALVTVDETLGVGFLVRTDYEGLLLSGKKYVLDTSRSGIGDEVYAYLSNEDSPQWANVPKPQTTAIPSTPPQHKPVTAPSVTKSAAASCITLQANSSTTPNKPAVTKVSERPPPGRQLTSFSSAPVRPVILSPMSIKSLTDDSQSQTSEAGSQNAHASEIRLTPHMFEVILLVDNAEIYGSGKGKEQLLQELQRNQVPLEVRKLQVGDFCWAARSKFNPEQELVLHHVVERKRMDDLASSIVDGRFKEQKFRMKNCGLKKPIYLVEDYGSMKHFSISEDALSQAIVNTQDYGSMKHFIISKDALSHAIVNTQIIDEFFVKRTADTKESAAYLTIMTRYLQSSYLTKTLCSYPKKQMDKLTADEAISSCEAKLLTFEEFDRLSVKTRALTVQEMLGKQLVQIRGITPEKAAVIVNQYPTPARLMDAYASCVTLKEKENLLATLKFGALQRNIGGAISKAVCMLYTQQTLS